MSAEAVDPEYCWEPGTVIHWIYRGTGRHSDKPSVRPMTVVQDDEHGLVAWLAPGTPLLKPVLLDGRETRAAGPVRMFTDDRVLKRDVWHGTGILKISPPGKPWSIWLFWNADGSFKGWYVNLEEEHVRDHVARRTTTTDHVLDLWMTPDRTVTWKDEDELEGAVAAGRFTASDAARITADAHAALEDIHAWRRPYSDPWPTWTPPAHWPLPPPPSGY